MRIVQISDSHISLDQPARTAELEACIRCINAADMKPDVVVHTGDIAHNGLVKEYEIARRLMDGLSAPYFVLAGNRDNRQALIEVFADNQHIKRGMDFIQYSIEHFDTRMICIDTVSGTGNKGRLCQARLAHVESMLSADKARKAVLFLHHPPFEVNVAPDPFQFEDWADADALQSLIEKHRQICGVYCGHVHRQAEAMIGSVPAQVATCIASDLRWDDVRSCIYTHAVQSSTRNSTAFLSDSVP